MKTTTRNRTIALGLIVVAVVCAGFAVFYFTQNTTFLAGPPARIQLKHGILAAGLAVVALISANIVWRLRT